MQTVESQCRIPDKSRFRGCGGIPEENTQRGRGDALSDRYESGGWRAPGEKILARGHRSCAGKCKVNLGPARSAKGQPPIGNRCHPRAVRNGGNARIAVRKGAALTTDVEGRSSWQTSIRRRGRMKEKISNRKNSTLAAAAHGAKSAGQCHRVNRRAGWTRGITWEVGGCHRPTLTMDERGGSYSSPGYTKPDSERRRTP